VFSVVLSGVSSGVTRGVKGTQLLGRRITAGCAKNSQQYHKYFLQCSTFSPNDLFRTGRRQTCFLSRPSSNFVMPFLRVFLGPINSNSHPWLSISITSINLKNENTASRTVFVFCAVFKAGGANQGCGSGYFVNRFRFQQNLDSNRAWALSHL